MKLSPILYAALCLTARCNLRCAYCYAHKSTRDMSVDNAHRSIDFLAVHGAPECTVTFFGGEPLLAFDLLQEVVRYAHATYPGRFAFRLSTNGTLLDRDRLDWLVANEIVFVLSLDGDRATHDRLRPLAGGGSSFARIEPIIDDLLQANPWQIAVSVVAPQTVRGLADSVIWLFDRGFRYVVQSLDYSADWNDSLLAPLREEYTLLANFYRDALHAGRKLYYSPFDERIRTHAQKPYCNGDLCDLAHTQLAIAASGRVYPCVQFIDEDGPAQAAHVIGTVTEGFDEQKRAAIVKQNYRSKTECEGCALNGRCATFCGCVNFRATGSIHTVPPVICEHERLIMPIVDDLATELWKKNSALFRDKFYGQAYALGSYLEDCAMIRSRET